MRIRLLGTGDAAGWPNAFCSCHSCSVERTGGRFRGNTAALIDDVLLLDCGPTVPAVAARFGADLSTVEHIVITHGHPDHCDPRILLSRTWSSTQHRVHLWGPPRAMDLCRPWISASEQFTLHEIEPGVISEHLLVTSVGEYRLQAIPATHQHPLAPLDDLAAEALIYSVVDPTEHRVLYATDTGPLPDTALAALDGPHDAVLIEQTFGPFTDHGTGHHDAVSLAAEVERFRAAGLVGDHSRVIAVHLGHHNPPLPALGALMSAIGVEICQDGDVVDTEHTVGTTAQMDAASSAASSRTLVLGGTRSGKSSWAEARAARLATNGQVVVIATGPLPDVAVDPEWATRVFAHQRRRPAHWRTVETTDPAAIIRATAPGTCIIVDCLGTWLTRVLDDAHAWDSPTTPDLPAAVEDCIADLVDAIAAAAAHVVLVSNEVGMSLIPTTASGRLFTDLLGSLNSRVGSVCTEVVLMVAGRAMQVTPEPP